MKPKKKVVKGTNFPSTIYVEQVDSTLLPRRTPEEVVRSFDEDETAVTVGVYELSHMARVTTEVKLTVCGPSKAGK